MLLRLVTTGDCEYYVNYISPYESDEIKILSNYTTHWLNIMLFRIEASSNLSYALDGLAITFKLCTFVGKRKPKCHSLWIR
ncbi:hypothetical protein U3516DRAFT_757416 [Neocallimastix sp. 'constans']